ncbi:glycosyltransferase family 32 protein [Flavivirga rizhaonensis]|uniref:Glycosyl transferase n=1 Tax=Flavivirga rizhaonensis TaxID=2559571 RepID=A0A4S1E211_9FLAO|nr:glycosyltransferase [Flavivirga rizhaonensis]TGV03952.1 glycosyl transferase [Flavivirga rizhaonensis]
MIPKKIHYCWLSQDPFPELIANCFESWKKILPDYEFILWDTKRFPLESNQWVMKAFETKKYAFAADYIRLYAVHKYGGIYLDTDIEVLKSFDSLLHLPYFIGSEGDGIIEAGVFGAEKGTKWLEDCLAHYNNRNFIKDDGSFDTLTLPRIMMKKILEKHTIIEIDNPMINKISFESTKNELFMFPKDFFCAKNHGTGIIEKTERTFSIHHFAMSWLPKKTTFFPNIKRKLISVFGVRFIYKIIEVFRLRELKMFLSKNK